MVLMDRSADEPSVKPPVAPHGVVTKDYGERRRGNPRDGRKSRGKGQESKPPVAFAVEGHHGYFLRTITLIPVGVFSLFLAVKVRRLTCLLTETLTDDHPDRWTNLLPEAG